MENKNSSIAFCNAVVSAVSSRVSIGSTMSCNITKITETTSSASVHLLASSILLEYFLAFTVAEGSTISTNALVNVTVTALIASVSEGDFISVFQTLLEEYGVSSDALMTASTELIGVASEVTIAPTDSPSYPPTFPPTAPPSRNTTNLTNSSGGTTNSTIFIIIGVVVGAVVVAGFLAFLYYFWSSRAVPQDKQVEAPFDRLDMDTDKRFGVESTNMAQSRPSSVAISDEDVALSISSYEKADVGRFLSDSSNHGYVSRKDEEDDLHVVVIDEEPSNDETV